MTKILQLQKFASHFAKSYLADAMRKTKEDSPWHRESSVWVHTEMVLAELGKIQEQVKMDDDTFIITYLSLLFHDTGKPPCMVVKYKPERGYYNAFHGHEQKSARLFEDYYVSNYKLFKDWLSVEDAYKVMWMIENHLPYDVMGNDKKMDYLGTAVSGNLGQAAQGFGWHLLSDTYGRISDDSTAKRAKTETFVEMMNAANVANPRFVEANAPTLMMLIGASGSGKSTYVKSLVDQGYHHYSFDSLRLDLANEKASEDMVKAKSDAHSYSIAYAYCDKHRSEFGRFSDVEYIKILKDYKSVVVDNTNVSRKNRTKFVVEAKKRGYRVEAAMFPVSKDILMARMASRLDKNVPDDAIMRQYDAVSIPWVGVEVDHLHFIDTNLPKK